MPIFSVFNILQGRAWKLKIRFAHQTRAILGVQSRRLQVFNFSAATVQSQRP
jgi:hypothetical protein